jgi:hypothetical protein
MYVCIHVYTNTQTHTNTHTHTHTHTHTPARPHTHVHTHNLSRAHTPFPIYYQMQITVSALPPAYIMSITQIYINYEATYVIIMWVINMFHTHT